MSVTALIVVIPLAILTIIWLVYDIYAAINKKQTITQWIMYMSQEYPAIPFLTGLMLGLLCGHLFLQF